MTIVSLPTPEHPAYAKILENDGSATARYMIICDEGWRSSIVAEGMYGWAADWLLEIIKGRPYAPTTRPGSRAEVPDA